MCPKFTQLCYIKLGLGWETEAPLDERLHCLLTLCSPTRAVLRVPQIKLTVLSLWDETVQVPTITAQTCFTATIISEQLLIWLPISTLLVDLTTLSGDCWMSCFSSTSALASFTCSCQCQFCIPWILSPLAQGRSLAPIFVFLHIRPLCSSRMPASFSSVKADEQDQSCWWSSLAWLFLQGEAGSLVKDVRVRWWTSSVQPLRRAGFVKLPSVFSLASTASHKHKHWKAKRTHTIGG